MNTRSQLPDDPLSGGKLCVYCGKTANTEDHAPPKCLLRKPLPSNLITLPACQECNSGFSFDESVVRMILAFVSSHPELVVERGSGGRIYRALERDRKLRGVRERSVQAGNGNYALTDEVFSSFQRVFIKTVQGLFFGLYDRVVPRGELTLDVIDNRRSVSPDQIVSRYRPSPLEDITDKPLSAITPSSWHSREPIMIMEMRPMKGGKPINRAFRLKRDTPVEWVHFQPGIFSFAFVKCEGDDSVCVIELWETLVIAVKTPWPDNRGPLRRGRKNPMSRDS